MFVHLEDWAKAPGAMRELSSKGLPHTGILIKAFATYEDPRVRLRKPGLFVFEADHSAFQRHEIFEFENRGSLWGPQLERVLQKGFRLNQMGNDSVRALFRFAEEMGLADIAMGVIRDGKFRFGHPFQAFDGIGKAIKMGERRESGIHLDIFREAALTALLENGGVDVRDPQQILPFGEHHFLVQVPEGNRRLAERK